MDIDTVEAGFVKALDNYRAKVLHWSAPLNEHQFWSKPFPFGNSFGHLVLHLTGNLNYYLGSQLLQTGYVRDRDLEFHDPNPPTKEAALLEFCRAVDTAIAAVHSQTSSEWKAEFQAVGMPEGMTRFDAVLQCTGHIFHHVGQMIYIAKQWEQQTTSTRA